MYAIYGNIYYQYTPNVSIYTIRLDPMGMASNFLSMTGGCYRWVYWPAAETCCFFSLDILEACQFEGSYIGWLKIYKSPKHWYGGFLKKWYPEIIHF